MNTHDIDIHTAIMDVITDVWDRAKQINEATYEVLDLIEADRKRWGEPAVQSDAEVAETCRAMGANSFAEFFGKTAPQPAEPVKVPSDAEIDAVFNDMPDGANGWLKSWGYRQFARALLARYGGGTP